MKTNVRLILRSLVAIAILASGLQGQCSMLKQTKVGEVVTLKGRSDFSPIVPTLLTPDGECRIPLGSLWDYESTKESEVVNDARYFAFLTYEIEPIAVRRQLQVKATGTVRRRSGSRSLLVSVEALCPLPDCGLKCRELFYLGNPFVKDVP